ncbi:FeoA family protein [Agarilytica rhodophyticola]|uniref:FeoA family protein n=1 Tax=Agarilytica rhodophyticola TaxID=1737490 RepID=UPI000B349A12|nr:FeoA family protein [Agarilytica rhodophyticola]
MTLAELKQNQLSRITGFSQTGETLNRLQTLGVIPGATAKILRSAPLGDPLQVRVDNTLLSIRAADAKQIHVECL